MLQSSVLVKFFWEECLNQLAVKSNINTSPGRDCTTQAPMHFNFFLIGFLALITQRSTASFLGGNFNGQFGNAPMSNAGGSQEEGQEAPTLVHIPVMHASPVVAAAPVSPVIHYGMISPRSEARNLVGSYKREEGHLLDTTIDIPLRKARARKLAARRAARKHKSLRKHRKANRH
ncbi:hypothetical protein Y032_0049g1836 [Ancylostoma ceylanicum]|uniref:Uncharacterized protein n=1 Tax=Ancylostoma ceylanicum TaxID=53326 RepID=A0A016UAB9_9BILA|nr:hypothetical protein Y032_0049g1836 [Ancylostoma ceylanicum]